MTSGGKHGGPSMLGKATGKNKRNARAARVGCSVNSWATRFRQLSQATPSLHMTDTQGSTSSPGDNATSTRRILCAQTFEVLAPRNRTKTLGTVPCTGVCDGCTRQPQAVRSSASSSPSRGASPPAFVSTAPTLTRQRSNGRARSRTRAQCSSHTLN